MKILIKKAKIYSSDSQHHLTIKDILIENNSIVKIGDGLSDSVDETVEGQDLCVSSGWFDPNVQFGDPGYEFNEDLTTGIKAAAAGGFTSVACMPNTIPVADSKGQIEYLINRSKGAIVNVYPIGSVSEKAKGENITELYDMHLSGAIAFSDGQIPLQNSNLLKKALLYSKRFGSKIMAYSEDTSIANEGIVNESAHTIHLGMKVRPAIGEAIQIKRNIELLKYTEGKLHLSCVSTKEGVLAVKQAKEQGLDITADVSINNIVHTDEELFDFDTNLKVLPVLRSQEDNSALLDGLEEGTIDFITSNHTPKNIEYKKVAFDHADFGTSTLETTFSSYCHRGLNIESFIKGVSEKSKQAFGLVSEKIEEGSEANLTIFSTSQLWEVTANGLNSKSKNNPWVGKKLKGKVIGVINNNQLHLN